MSWCQNLVCSVLRSEPRQERLQVKAVLSHTGLGMEHKDSGPGRAWDLYFGNLPSKVDVTERECIGRGARDRVRLQPPGDLLSSRP